MSHTIELVLAELVELMMTCNESEWGAVLSQLASELEERPQDTKAQIRSMFGGMGSFNDIVLYGKDGSPLQKENDRLAFLRSKLYECSRP